MLCQRSSRERISVARKGKKEKEQVSGTLFANNVAHLPSFVCVMYDGLVGFKVNNVLNQATLKMLAREVAKALYSVVCDVV